MSWDNYSYGPSIINVIEYLATAVSSIYQLNPPSTVWIQHLSPSSGTSDADESSIVTFNFDEILDDLKFPDGGKSDHLEYC